ncbi:MAG TPA: amino acid permease [Candidatus Limnocylindrales bacterium]|nr:amino acid permease [Candidatus Limnocylindrales bacterium]
MSTTTRTPAPHKLFTRQSSGLVREVSVSNALFFNTAAFIGTGLAWYPVFYALPFIPVGVFLFSTYGWAAIIVGAAAVLLSLIFASLTSVMPRSGGDYVFTTRLIPRVGPFIGWLESFTLVFSSLAIIAFEVPIVLRNLQITGRIIGIGTGASFFSNANSWFADNGTITGWPGFIGALLVLALIFWVVIQPTRRFHAIITTLAILALSSGVLMFVFGMLFTSQSSLESHLPSVAGTTAAAIAKAAQAAGVVGNGAGIFPISTFSFMAGVLLFQYIGFQYSAYIAGEVTGNVRRGILIAVLGALAIAVVMNSVYTDFLSERLGFTTQLGWGAMFWSGDAHLPMGQPNSLPLLATISTSGLWPIWAIVSLAGTVFPFLLCPVYLNFISRIGLAWSLDRRVPEWFGDVNERLRAPVNAIVAALVVAVLFAVLQNFPLLGWLPSQIAPPGGKLNLIATAWFSLLMAFLTWFMPGINALVGPFTRRDLLKNAPSRAWLPLFGLVWAAFIGVLYWFAGLKPILDSAFHPNGQTTLEYLNSSGVLMALFLVVVAIVVYIIMAIRNRVAGVDTAMMYQVIPPE